MVSKKTKNEFRKLSAETRRALQNTGSQSELKLETRSQISRLQEDAEARARAREYSERLQRERYQEALRLQRQIASPNLSPEFRLGLVNQYEKVSSFAPSRVNEQVRESQRKIQESRMRREINRASLISDPAAQMERLQGIQNEYSSLVGPGSRVLRDTASKIGALGRKVATQADMNRAAGIRASVSGSDSSAADKLTLLASMRTSESGEKTLKEIEKLIREQNKLVAEDKRNFEKARSDMPVSTAIFGPRGGGPNGPGTLSTPQFNRIAMFSQLGRGVLSGAITAGITANEFARSGVRAEELAFQDRAAAQAMAARRRYDTLGNFGGEGLFRKYGNIFGYTNETRYTGMEGQRRAREEGISNAGETQRQEFRDAMLSGGIKAVGGIAALGAAGLAGVTGAGLPVAGALGAAGFAGLSSGLQELFGSRAVQATGVLGERRKNKAQEAYNLMAEQSAQGLTDADVARNLFYTNSLDAASNLRRTDAAALAAMGSSAVSFRGALAGRFNRAAAGFTPFDRKAGRVGFADEVSVASGFGGRGPIEQAAALGLSASELTGMVAGAGQSFDSRYRGDVTQSTLNLRKLELSGRGSFEQLLGNIQNLNRVGGGDSERKLTEIMAKGVEAGVKGARLSQEFASAVISSMGASGNTNASDAAARFALMMGAAGGGEKGLKSAKDAQEDFKNVGQNVLVQALATRGAAQAFAGLKTGASSDPTKFASLLDNLNAMDPQSQISTMSAIESIMKAGGTGTQAGQKIAKGLSGPQLDVLSFFRGADSQEALKAFGSYRQRLKESMFGGAGGAKKFDDAIKALSGKKGMELNLGIREALQGSGAAGLLGFGGEAALGYLANFTDLSPEQLKDLKGSFGKGSATDQKAVDKFKELNKLDQRRIMFENAQIGGGESMLTNSLLNDLKRGKMRSGSSITEMAANANLNLAGFGNLGTNLSQKRIGELFGSKADSQKILQMAEALSSGQKIDEKGFTSEQKQLAQAIAFQTRMDAMDRMEIDRLGPDKMSVVSILPSSAALIGESVARAMGVTGPRDQAATGSSPAQKPRSQNPAANFFESLKGSFTP